MTVIASGIDTEEGKISGFMPCVLWVCDVLTVEKREPGVRCNRLGPDVEVTPESWKAKTMDLGLLTHAIANRGREAIEWTGWNGRISPARQKLESAYKTCAIC